MRMNHDTHIDTEIDEALTRAGITADNIPGTREAAREFTRLVTTRTNHTPHDALRIAAEAIARTLHLAATAPARGGTIPQVTFLPPATAEQVAEIDAVLDELTAADPTRKAVRR